MKEVIYKYKVGDRVKFKDKFHSPSCGLVGREGTTVEITGLAPAYDNKPNYYIEGDTSVYRESCFAGLSYEPKFASWELADSEPDSQ